MANITDPVAISFSDQTLRPVSDHLAGMEKRLADMVADWTAANLNPVYTNNAADMLEDGAFGGDGRVPVSGADVQTLKTALLAIKAVVDANSAIFHKFSVNTRE
jgi:hypothetical protein